MKNNFRTYQIAVEFYALSQSLKLSRHLREQLARASSSVALNLAEGSGRGTPADQARFYRIAYGSLRECRAVLDLAMVQDSQIRECANKLGAHIYRLIQSRGG